VLKNNSFFLIIILLLCSSSIYSQYVEKAGGNTFYYDDDDIKKDQLNFHNVFYSGFSTSFVKVDDNISLPVLPTIYFEYKYLLLPKNDKLNFSGNINPHIALFNWFLMRIPASININFVNEASTEHKDGFGLSIGAGYEYVASSFDFNEHSPFIQLGIKIDNVKLQYEYKLSNNLIINHSVSVGVQLNL
jgi:hypothetical protein